MNATDHMTPEAIRAQVYKVPEVARILRCDKNTVYGLIERGDLKAVRLGRVMRVTQAAINEFLGE